MNEHAPSISGGRSLLPVIFQAVLILAIAFGIAQGLFLPAIQDPLLKDVQGWEAEYLNSGTIDLLAAELNSVPAESRAAHLIQRAPFFGFDISLQKLSDVELDRDSLERLRNAESVGDATDYTVYKLLNDDKQVLVFEDTKKPASHLVTEAQRRSMGTIAMLEQALHGQPESTWQSIIAERGRNFGYPVALEHTSNITLNDLQLAEFDAGRIVAVETQESVTADYPAEFIYKKHGDMALVLGPFSPPTLKRYYPLISVFYAALGLLVLIPLGLWLTPTWRSMNQLSNATSAFGQGDFSARASRIRGSKTNDLIAVFNQMAEKIQSLVESNKALINAVSHELRTPISRIEFNLELARQSTDIVTRNKQFDRIEGSVDELRTMVSEMLQYARFDREKPNFTMETVDVGEWLNSGLEAWHIGDDIPKIEVVVPEAATQVSLERYYMNRAISNLVRNACRFAATKVEVSARVEAGLCEISVSDDGPGVDYQDRTKIFEPFVRRDESRNRESGGTGLGLAIVKQILIWHGGEVWVDDSRFGGARFVAQWPLIKGA